MARLISFVLLFVLVATVRADIVASDFLGREVRLAAPAKRIVALAPHIVENIYSIGAGDLLVGAVGYSNYPEAAKQLPRVGSYNAFSLEAILALQPDLVVAWASGNGTAVVQQLEALGITVYVDQIDRLDDVATSLRDLAILSGLEAHGFNVAKAFSQRLAGLRQRYSGQSKVSVLYQVWNEPLQTVNGEHIISDTIELCGGVNVYADAQSIAPKISIESVFAKNPQAIIASGMDEARPEWLDEWLKWPQLSAVSNANLYFIPPDILQRHTVRLLDGANRMCEKLQQVRDKSSTHSY